MKKLNDDALDINLFYINIVLKAREREYIYNNTLYIYMVYHIVYGIPYKCIFI